jgi:hypothetical protein
VSASTTIWYRGATYQLGRGPGGYAIWALAGAPSEPVEQWPETPGGWAAAWARFTALEDSGSIAHLAAPAAPAAPTAAAAPAAALVSPAIAAAILATGVACGIAGLFPAYLGGASLAAQPDLLVTHLAYLAAWAVSGVLIALPGGRCRPAGALLGLGTGIVVFGFFATDVATVISGGAGGVGAGLLLGLTGWLGCTAGAALAFRPGPGGAPRKLATGAVRPLVALSVTALAALGAAAAFAPSWDRYTLQAPSGLSRSVTAGNVFASPGLVIAGNLAVMIAFVAVAVVAASWRPARLGAALLGGALVPMAAQAVSALVQIGEGVSPALFGIPPAQAAQAGLVVSAGLTPVFWAYCAFVVVLAAVCGWLLIPARPRRLADGGPVPGQPGFPVGQSPQAS